jgi:integrase/recombinase XerD
MNSVGQTVFAFFEDYLKAQKGLRPGSIRSYRDTLKLFLIHVAATRRRPITRLVLEDLSSERVLDFLRMIETTRNNHVSTRNQRLAALHTFYRYLAVHHPEMLAEAERVEAIPSKRTAPPQTHYLERDEIEGIFQSLPKQGALALRDRTLFMVLYNTGARAQEVADLSAADIDLNGPLRVRLHRKGDKWRSCPLWPETVELLKELMRCRHGNQSSSLFISRQGKPLTRFGIYKIVKRHTSNLRVHLRDKNCRGISPHVIRHYVPFRTMSSDFAKCWRSFDNARRRANRVDQSPGIVFLRFPDYKLFRNPSSWSPG